MGLILDTDLLIRAERLGLPVHQAVESWLAKTDGRELGISVISLAELGRYRASRQSAEAHSS